MTFLCFLLVSNSSAQVAEGEVLDRILAVVGGEVVLKSDLEAQKDQQKQQMARSGLEDVDKESDCGILERIMYQKLLLHQAKVDSVVVSDSRVDSEMDRRIRYFVRQIGSREKLEEFYGMSVDRIKEEFRPGIKEQLRIQRMQQEILQDVSVTPSEVKEYFNRLPEDSVPLVDASIRYAQIVKKPQVDEKALENTRKRLQEFKKRLEEGEKSFSVLATLYSDDPGSANNGGELGFIERGDMVKEFEAAVFELEEGEISDPFRTQHGFHIAQVQEKRGQKLKVRHVLLKPKVEASELDRVKQELKDIAEKVRLNDTISFADAAKKHSDDDKTRKSGGRVVNRETGSSSFEMEELDPDLSFAMEDLKVGEMSEPLSFEMEEGEAFRIVKLLEKTEPHRATLETDYRFLQERAKKRKEDRKMKEWMNEKLRETYVRMDEEFHSCKFEHDWLAGSEQ